MPRRRVSPLIINAMPALLNNRIIIIQGKLAQISGQHNSDGTCLIIKNQEMTIIKDDKIQIILHAEIAQKRVNPVICLSSLTFDNINKFIMQSQQDEVATLMKKIEQQDDIITKLKTEQTKLTNYIKQFKQAIEKKMSKDMDSSVKNGVDQEKIQKQLEKELENARIMLKNYHNELKNLQKKNTKNKFTSDDLIEMENNIKKKEGHIKELNEDIKNLTIVKRKQEKMIEKKQKNEDGIKLTKLVDQIRKQREVLESLKVKHQQKKEGLEKRKQAISELQILYTQKCKKYGEKPLNFEQFKEKRVQKRRQESVSKPSSERKQPKKYLSIKDIINSHLDIENIEISEKSLNQLREKKSVAQNSLKIAKKKFQKQFQEYQQRIETLKSEHDSLHTKYLQKKKEKELIETSRLIEFKRNSSKTMRKLDPIK